MNYIFNYTNDKPIIIAGAGISGLVLSILLKKLDKNILIIEKRSLLQLINPEDSRSFNMTISERGMKCFRELGIEKKILEYAHPIKNRIIHIPSTNPIIQNKVKQSYGKEKEDLIFSIKRNNLIKILYEESLKNKNTKILFDSELIDINRNSSSLIIHSYLTNQELILSYNFLVGADGVYSKTREFILSGRIINFQINYFNKIYKKFSISSAEAKLLKMDPSCLHIFPKNNSIVFSIPNQDQSFSSIYCCDIEELSDIHSVQAQKQVETRFKKDFPHLFHLSKTLRDTLNFSKIGSLVDINLSKWSYEDKIIQGNRIIKSFSECFLDILNLLLQPISLLPHRTS